MKGTKEAHKLLYIPLDCLPVGDLPTNPRTRDRRHYIEIRYSDTWEECYIVTGDTFKTLTRADIMMLAKELQEALDDIPAPNPRFHRALPEPIKLDPIEELDQFCDYLGVPHD